MKPLSPFEKESESRSRIGDMIHLPSHIQDRMSHFFEIQREYLGEKDTASLRDLTNAYFESLKSKKIGNRPTFTGFNRFCLRFAPKHNVRISREIFDQYRSVIGSEIIRGENTGLTERTHTTISKVLRDG